MNESVVEQAALGWFESLGYGTAHGADISPNGRSPEREKYETVILAGRLRTALRRFNDQFDEGVIDEVMRVVCRPPKPTMERNNRWFHDLLSNGINVEYRTADGETRGHRAWLLDFANADRNDWLVVNQFTVVEGDATRRPDLVVFLNGIPVAVIELKDPTDEQADLWKAYRQLQDYKRHVSALFAYNEILAISDGDSTRVGSLTARGDRFSPWRSMEDTAQPGEPTLEAFVKGLFEPPALLEYLRYCVTFEEDERSGDIIKKIGGYHQFRAVRKATASVQAALKPPAGSGDGRGGVVWHTQGSGKSLTMLMLSASLIDHPALENPTVVVVSDRNDLDGQLFDTFAAGRALLRQDPVQAESQADLTAKLDRASGGVIFTTIQKFTEHGRAVTNRANVVVMADEAHRSQYGFVDGGARWMRDAMPNATFVGFTGTPIARDDANTQAVFGEYADIYDIRQAIDDNATVPVYYESRLVKLLPDEEGITEAERRLRDRAADANRDGREPTEDIRVPLEELVGAPTRVIEVARQIVEHFERRLEVIEGKGMVVGISRPVCMDLYDEVVALRPDWHEEGDDAGFVKVVMDANVTAQRNGESDADYGRRAERTQYHGRTKARREAIARRFKNPEDELRLVIVCDMWLTGFDCPPLHTMYLDKMLAGHNLMQAIARVNRVFGQKPGGVVVDFLGIAQELSDAVRTYTQAGGAGEPVHEIAEEAVPAMLRDAERMADFFNEHDHSAFIGGNEADQLRAVTAGADYVFAQDDGRRRFMAMVASLSRGFALAVPREETEAVRDHLAYYQAVRAAIRKRLSDDGYLPAADSREAVRQVISGAIVSDGVLDLFQAAGLPEPNVGILSDDFLNRLAGMQERNLAFETLRKLLNDQIRCTERVNIVQSRTFRESLEATLHSYTSRAITTAEVIDELIGLARTIREAAQRGETEGLQQDELAFYDALADNESACEVMEDATLKTIARELADRIKAKATLDWTQREAVRADMRRTIRRLLNKYGYPPDAQEAATQLVIRQAELLADLVVEAG